MKKNQVILSFLSILLIILPIIAYAQQLAQNFKLHPKAGFTENKGQIADQNGVVRKDVKYLYSAPGLKLILQSNSFSYEVFTLEKEIAFSEATGLLTPLPFPDRLRKPEDFTIKTHRVDVSFVGANPKLEIIAEERSSSYKNYFLGHTPEEGVREVYTYSKLTYKNLYPNIDIVFYAKEEGKLKYDIVVRPGGRLEDLKMNYSGADGMAISDKKLKIYTYVGQIEEEIPYSYLIENKKKITVNYALKDDIISFKTYYDRSKTLIIDPVLMWGTYYGGRYGENGNDISIDSDNNIIITGITTSDTEIGTQGAHQTDFRGGYYDAFISKFNNSGIKLWDTYYGGYNEEQANGITVDNKNNIYITGATESSVGIATSGSHQDTKNGKVDIYIAKFDSKGVRQWGTYIGGSKEENAFDIAVDADNSIYITGYSQSETGIATKGTHKDSFPGGLYNSYIIKFNENGKRQWGTYHGGGYDISNGICIDKNANIYITGNTSTNTGIATPGAHQDTLGGDWEDGFIAKFDSSGTKKWGTYYGGENKDYIYGITMDKKGSIYIVGYTWSKNNISTPWAYKVIKDVTTDAFIVKFDSNGKRQWGTYYGGAGTEYAYNIICDLNYNIFICGVTSSQSGIATPGSHQTVYRSGDGDGFIAGFDSTSNLIWGSYYGGSGVGRDCGTSMAVDKWNNLFLLGYSNSNGGIATKGAHKWYKPDIDEDAFIAKFTNIIPPYDIGVLSIDSSFIGSCPGNYSFRVKIKNFSYSLSVDSLRIGWSVNGSHQNAVNWKGILKVLEETKSITLGNAFLNSGNNYIKIWSKLPNNAADADPTNDTLYLSFFINTIPEPGTDSNKIICLGDSIYIGKNSIPGVRYSWVSNPPGFTSSKANPKVSPSITTVYYLTQTMDSTNCSRKDSIIVEVNNRVQPVIIGDTVTCFNSFTKYATNNDSNIVYKWGITQGTILQGQGTDTIWVKWNSAGNGTVKVLAINKSGCKDSSVIFIKLDSSACDWVWPGDADYNKIVNKQDVLQIGLAYNDTGAARRNANSSWKAQLADDWSKSFSTGLNYKHADCNGDGIVDSTDIQVITSNYGQAWKKKGGSQSKAGPNDAGLILVFAMDSFYAGETAHIAIKLGTSTIPAKDVYGLAFSFTFDPRVVETSSIRLDLTNSWMAPVGSELISLIKEFSDKGFADLAISRINKKNISGEGKIGTLSFKIKGDITGSNILSSEILDLLAISVNEDTIPLNAIGDSVIIYKKTSGINYQKVDRNGNIKLYPNPFTNSTTLEYELQQREQVGISIYDLAGKEISTVHNGIQNKGKYIFTIEASKNQLKAGIYIIKAVIGGQIISRQLINLKK